MHIHNLDEGGIVLETRRWILREEFFGGILYDTVGKTYFYVDSQTYEALRQICDEPGKVNLSLRYIKFLEREGIIGVNPRGEFLFPGRIIEYLQTPDDFPTAPLRIHLAITYRCPLNCAHCFVKNHESDEKEMDTDKIKGLIDRLVEIGTYEILVSGGEPLTRTDLSDCLSYALRKGMIVKLFTNGLLLDQKKIKELEGLQLSYLAIGFDGPDPVSYSSIRGKVDFERVLRHIQQARESLDIQVAIQFTCTRRNTDPETLSRLVDFSVKNDVFLRVRPVNPCGNTLNNPDLLLDYSEYLDILQTLYELFLKRGCSADEKMKAKQGNIPFKFSRRSIKFDDTPLPYLGWGCPGGYVHAFIDPYGKMHPCGFLVGCLPQENNNIETRELLDIWLNGKGFLYKRSLPGNDACFECKYFVTCRGGCRIRALHWKGDINAPDQFCRKELEASRKMRGLFLGEGCV